MIIHEIFIFFISFVILSMSISGHGSLMTYKIKSNLFIDIFFGFIVISFLITLLHFFVKINFLISLIIFLTGLFLFFKNKTSSLKEFLKENIFLYQIILILFFIPMFLSQKYHEDFGYYHLPYALAFLEEKIVFGFANIDKSFVYNSIWLNLNSIFFLEEKNYNFLTLPSFIIFLSFIIFSINKLIKKKNILTSDYYLVVILFYFLLKFTRISEFGVDLPSVVFSILGIYYFIKFFETNLIKEKKIYFYFNLTFSIFSILIKLSTLPIILLTFYIYFRNFIDLKYYIFRRNFFIIYLLCLLFIIQQFIYTGCFIFPSQLTCLDFSWFNLDYLNLSKKLELINKSYSEARNIYSPQEYLNNFNWFSFWLQRNYIEISEHLLTISLPTLIFIFTLKRNANNSLFFKEKKILYIFLFLNLFFWLNFSPVYRFAIHLFATLIFLFLLNFLILSEFSKKKFIIFISIFILFSFSKNIIRINNTDNIFLGIQKMDNKYIFDETHSNKYVNVFYPDIETNHLNGWQGRLCWDIPFICTYNKIEVKNKYGYLIINKLKN